MHNSKKVLALENVCTDTFYGYSTKRERHWIHCTGTGLNLPPVAMPTRPPPTACSGSGFAISLHVDDSSSPSPDDAPTTETLLMLSLLLLPPFRPPKSRLLLSRIAFRREWLNRVSSPEETAAELSRGDTQCSSVRWAIRERGVI